MNATSEMPSAAVRPKAEAQVAARLAALSTREIVDALGAGAMPALARVALELAASIPSRRLGRSLARFDARVGARGLVTSAREVLTELGATVDVDGECPARGPLLVVVNHPGAYDALALMAAVGRDDAALLAADRAFLRAMPHLARRLVFASESDRTLERARTVRDAVDWMARGGALVQFGAGMIEPDARFSSAAPCLAWSRGTGLLARRAAKLGAAIVPAFVSGVHSPRAKRLFFVRWAELRGTTTIAPLVQATLPGFRDVRVAVRFGAALRADELGGDDAARTELLRGRVASLAPDQRDDDAADLRRTA